MRGVRDFFPEPHGSRCNTANKKTAVSTDEANTGGYKTRQATYANAGERQDRVLPQKGCKNELRGLEFDGSPLPNPRNDW